MSPFRCHDGAMKGKYPNNLGSIMKKRGIGVSELARMVSTHKQNISRLANGERELTGTWASMLAPHLKTSPQDLIFANGAKVRVVNSYDPDSLDPVREFDAEAPPNIDPDAPPEIPKNGVVEADTRAGMGPGGELAHVYRRDGDEITTVDAVKPEPWVFPKWFMDTEMRARPADLMMIEVRGDSMSPTIEPGTVVAIDIRHRIPSPDGVYAIRDRWGQIQVKRIETAKIAGDHSVHVISDNGHRDEVANSEDDITIVGKVVGGWRRF